ncbi:MAG: cache domain-containing protein [Ignavibacteria bacterium]|jgi:two-component system NtrC family sensor kinase
MKKISAKSIQSQLIIYFTIAILTPTLIISIIGTKLIYNQIVTRAENKSISDLNSAREIYRNKISQIEYITRLTAARSFIISSLIENNSDTLQKELQVTLMREKLDIFTIVDKKGRVVSRGRNAFKSGDTLLTDKFIQRVLDSGKTVSGTDIVPAEELAKESYELVDKASMNIIPTPKSKPRKEQHETSGMMIKSASPLFDRNKNLVGVLMGGILLNRNYEIVDKIKEVVHEKEVYKGQEIGTATIFENDYRISTNVKNEDGSYAISTLVSDEVYDRVLLEGERYVGDAFVVNAWYLAAYEPIRNIDNNIVGILYVGILKQPFNDLMRSTILTFSGVAVGVILIIIFVALFMTKRIARPLRKLEEVAKKITDGDYKANFSIKAPREIDNLAQSLNKMSIELEKEKNELESWANKLEVKVEERTDELKKIHEQLFRSEKLASLGKLAAGVAHEINNPLTGVLTNSSLLLEDLDANDPRREDVEVIVKETIRCREIVKRLLDFARQTKPQKKLTNINSLIDNIILLVRNQSSFRNITIEKNLDENIPEIMADLDQIQQVFINLILNASDAMNEGGTLTIESKLTASKDYIEVKFTDTGIGIPDEVKAKIFDPFFTTKGHGTGLGLSISYGIIERHGGKISVDSKPGKGTIFTIHLPVQNIEEGDD